ncbi:MAG: sn-glycerol-3-phosphate ABC transporter ATP-binding protein UgpC [Silicimonas sp.]|nr:sn-glycerol-3-phosphate ABC transporter ATP-binding protein UgpC [Silicimonas sp.]
MAAITLEQVVKRFGRDEVIHGIDLRIAHDEFVVLVGPSGCGKSTTLRMIAGLEDLSDGTIRIGDQVVNDLPPRKRNLAMVFQNYALYPHMNVRQNLGFGLTIAGEPKEVVAERVQDTAALLGLSDLLDRLPAELSGGERQRVAMGRALVRRPEAFLFDEPLSNLDAKLRVQMRGEIKRLHTAVRTTIVYVTHDQVEAMTLADRIVVMQDGRIEQIGQPMTLFDHPVNTFVAGFIGTPPMNLIPARIAGDEIAFNDGQQIPLPDRFTALVTEGQSVIFGLRPDHLCPDKKQRETGTSLVEIPLKVHMIEPHGAEMLLHARLAGQPVLGKMYAPRPVAPGDQLTFQLALDKIHLFDAASGRSVTAR